MLDRGLAQKCLVCRIFALRPGDPALDDAVRYDSLVWFVTLRQKQAFREMIFRLVRVEPDESILDVHCGTGSLAIAAKRQVGRLGRSI